VVLIVYTVTCKIEDGMARNQKPSDWDKNRVRALRRHMGLTQAELAKVLGTRQQTISEWETGIYKPRGTSAMLLNIVAERSEFKYYLEEESRR